MFSYLNLLLPDSCKRNGKLDIDIIRCLLACYAFEQGYDPMFEEGGLLNNWEKYPDDFILSNEELMRGLKKEAGSAARIHSDKLLFQVISDIFKPYPDHYTGQYKEIWLKFNKEESDFRKSPKDFFPVIFECLLPDFKQLIRDQGAVKEVDDIRDFHAISHALRCINSNDVRYDCDARNQLVEYIDLYDDNVSEMDHWTKALYGLLFKKENTCIRWEEEDDNCKYSIEIRKRDTVILHRADFSSTPSYADIMKIGKGQAKRFVIYEEHPNKPIHHSDFLNGRHLRMVVKGTKGRFPSLYVFNTRKQYKWVWFDGFDNSGRIKISYDSLMKSNGYYNPEQFVSF